MSPAATLAAQLRELAALAAAHSSPSALSSVLAEGFAAIAGTLEEAERVVGDGFAAALAALPLTDDDRAALRAAGVPLADAPAGAQVFQFPNSLPPGVHLAGCFPPDLTPEQFEQEVTAARAILFGQVAG